MNSAQRIRKERSQRKIFRDFHVEYVVHTIAYTMRFEYRRVIMV